MRRAKRGAFRLARIHFQKGQLDDALQALARIKGTVPEESRVISSFCGRMSIWRQPAERGC